MNIGEKIKELRTKGNLSQAELAERAQISRVAIGNYERGDRIPNVEILNKIANALNINLSELLNPQHITTKIENHTITDILVKLQDNDSTEISMVCYDLKKITEHIYRCSTKLNESELMYIRNFLNAVSSTLELYQVQEKNDFLETLKGLTRYLRYTYGDLFNN